MNGDERPARNTGRRQYARRRRQSRWRSSRSRFRRMRRTSIPNARISGIPIHTDAEVAADAGLPAIMLHGTATLALAVSKIIAAEVSNQPERVAEVYARFGAMVFMPSEVVVRNRWARASRGTAGDLF